MALPTYLRSIIAVVLIVCYPIAFLRLSSSWSSSQTAVNNNSTLSSFGEGRQELKEQQPQQRVEYINHSDVIYGHIHICKSGGTSLNGMIANQFERVCGHKGYSYDAYNANEKAKKHIEANNVTSVGLNFNSRADRIVIERQEEIGFEDCDYISAETNYHFFIYNFGSRRFHGIPMELHVPCRDPIDHLMSKCNMRNIQLNCTGTGTGGDDDDDDDMNDHNNNEFIQSIQICLKSNMDRYKHKLKNYFDTIKCYDFKKQFTAYVDYMAKRLQPRRLISKPYIQRDSNQPRNKSLECIWDRPDLLVKARNYLLQKYDWHNFCEECMGSENEIAREKSE